MLANWTQANVFWPSEVSYGPSLALRIRNRSPPLRADRDTVVVGVVDKKIEAPVAVKMQIQGVSGASDLTGRRHRNRAATTTPIWHRSWTRLGAMTD